MNRRRHRGRRQGAWRQGEHNGNASRPIQGLKTATVSGTVGGTVITVAVTVTAVCCCGCRHDDSYVLCQSFSQRCIKSAFQGGFRLWCLWPVSTSTLYSQSSIIIVLRFQFTTLSLWYGLVPGSSFKNLWSSQNSNFKSKLEVRQVVAVIRRPTRRSNTFFIFLIVIGSFKLIRHSFFSYVLISHLYTVCSTVSSDLRLHYSAYDIDETTTAY
jgi:hypothetical protein